MRCRRLHCPMRENRAHDPDAPSTRIDTFSRLCQKQDRKWPVSAAKARVAGSKKAQCSPWHDLMLREAAKVRATFLAAWRTVRSCLSANAARRGPSWTRRPRTAQVWA